MNAPCAQGGFNRSSQHLDLEVGKWATAWLGGGSDGLGGDAVSGAGAGVARAGAPAAVLGGDRWWCVE